MAVNKSILLVFLLTVCWAATAQGQSDEDDDEYQTEFMYGLNFNTNGGLIGGIVFRYSTVINDKMKQTFGVEIVNVKNPKEIRAQSGNGNAFVLGKSNYLFVVRPQYGRERVIFRKAPEEGVRISAVGAAGLSLAVIKPYFIVYQNPGGDQVIVQYNPVDHTSSANIIGTTGLTRFDGTRFSVGLNIKAGLAFEIGGFRSSATGFEVGGMIEAFPNEIVIMPLAENRRVFTSVYLNIYFKNKR
ncbi:MAG: hypothetical protein MUD08_13050 [Cytophagales bacterium]|nr:hypothetical protein [Cytophagales bacterium]